MKYSEIENNSTITPDELKGVNIPDLAGKAGAFSNYTFWQYTNVETICKILGGSCFWVNNISGMNDLREAELHGAKKEDIFVQCFCNSDTEKIPMWYLYGGIVGRGASIGFTPAVMMNYIRSIKFVTELVEDPDKGFTLGEKLEIVKILICSSDGSSMRMTSPLMMRSQKKAARSGSNIGASLLMFSMRRSSTRAIILLRIIRGNMRKNSGWYSSIRPDGQLRRYG